MTVPVPRRAILLAVGVLLPFVPESLRRRVAGLVCAFVPVLAATAWSDVTHLKPTLIGGATHREAQQTRINAQGSLR